MELEENPNWSVVDKVETEEEIDNISVAGEQAMVC